MESTVRQAASKRPGGRTAETTAKVNAAVMHLLSEQGVEGCTIPAVAMRAGVSTLSYSSLALGLLTGTVPVDRVFDGDDLRRDDPRFSSDGRRKALSFAAALAPLAESHGASVTQLVIAWTLQQPGITFALCGARSVAQAIDNARAGELTLTAADLATIDCAAATHLASLA